MTAHLEARDHVPSGEDWGHLIFSHGKRVAHDHHAEHALMSREMGRL